MNGSLDSAEAGVMAHDLLDSSGAVRLIQPGFEQIQVLRMCLEICLDGQTETRGEKDISILAAFAALDEYLTGGTVDIDDANCNQLTHSNCREKQEL